MKDVLDQRQRFLAGECGDALLKMVNKVCVRGGVVFDVITWEM